MKIKLLRKLGLFLGLVLIFLAASEFSRSYHAGAPKWNYIFLIFGMLIILFYTLFGKRR